MTEWLVCKSSELEEGNRKLIKAEETEIGVFRIKGKYYAYKNICHHQGGPVCTGQINGKVEVILTEDKRVLGETFSEHDLLITCPWHGYDYNIETGDCVGDKRLKLKSYEVIEKGDELYVIL